MKYWLRCLRSWWYWRRHESPGKTLDQQAAFATTNLKSGTTKGLWE